MLIRCRVWVAAPEPWDQRTTPAMVDATPFLPGLSPVQGKAVIARFDGGRLSSEGGLLALREIESAELSWRSSGGLNPKSAPRISSASALISALRGSYGVFVTPSPSATACADATRLPIQVAAIGVPVLAKSAPMHSVSRERGGTRFTTTMSPRLARF